MFSLPISHLQILYFPSQSLTFKSCVFPPDLSPSNLVFSLPISHLQILSFPSRSLTFKSCVFPPDLSPSNPVFSLPISHLQILCFPSRSLTFKSCVFPPDLSPSNPVHPSLPLTFNFTSQPRLSHLLVLSSLNTFPLLDCPFFGICNPGKRRQSRPG